MDNQLKIVVELHEGEKATKKIWRFGVDLVQSYTKTQLEEDIECLFPHIKEKGLKLQLYHYDELAGKVVIDGDVDVVEALNNFIQESHNECRPNYMVLHAEDIIPPLARTTEIAHCSSSSGTKRQKRKRQSCNEKNNTQIGPPKAAKLDMLLEKCDKEDITDSLGVEQPLFIEEQSQTIKCRWCPSWVGSSVVKVANQHTRKAVSHRLARIKELNLPQQAPLVDQADHDQCNTHGEQPTSRESQSQGTDVVPCQGMYTRKYSVLYSDGVAGGTTAKRLWQNGRECQKASYTDQSYSTFCKCCDTYRKWKSTHIQQAKFLQSLADAPTLYQILPGEEVVIEVDGQQVMYTGTIRALPASPMGACTGFAKPTGSLAFTCDACDALVHGQSSPLNRRLYRTDKLKHPRSDQERATKRGVNHKYCSKAHLKSALVVRKAGERKKAEKISGLIEANKKLLHRSWHSNTSVKPFVQTLITLLEEKKLSDFDLSFLENWLGKKEKGRFFRADEQARNLAILYSNKLGEKMYTTTAPLLGLPSVRQARRIRAKEMGFHHYLPGLNEWAVQLASMRPMAKPLQHGMDGTRIIRTVELYLDKYLVGREFPPDVRFFKDQLVEATSMIEVQQHILEVRQNNAYAAEAYSFNLSDTTGEFPDILIGSIPESKTGVTGDCILALMLEVEKLALKHKIPLTGHCTDSAANALNALLKLASPTTFIGLLPETHFIGLPMSNFFFFAPLLRSYPSIAYPCWDHSSRTVLRNLMNDNITIVCSTIPNQGDGIQLYQTASIRDLHTLKNRLPDSSVRHSDINRNIKQNCDATTRVLTRATIEDLATHVPESRGTQLYLQAAVWTHEPFRNNKFGPPPVVARSLWAGLMTWRRWRRYIQSTPGLTLTNNFISRSHYMTEELLVHAGINHLLSLFYAFPHLPVSEYSLRNTGNRGLEAIHGIFRGGSASLPITSPNLSFREFLSKMNQTLQVHQAEQNLKQISGHTIVASKKKRVVCAHESCDQASEEEYTKPETYKEFVEQIMQACMDGDEDSKVAITQLAPDMASVLKTISEWDSPNVGIDLPPSNMSVVTAAVYTPSTCTQQLLESLIEKILGSSTYSTPASNRDSTQLTYPDITEAYANFLTDVTVTECDDITPPSKQVQSFLKDVQPYREKPSKDRSRRFAAGNLPLNSEADASYDLQTYQYWTVYPTDLVLKSAKVFILSQIIFVSEEEKPVQQSMRTNPTTRVMLNVFEHDPTSLSYTPAGRSAVLYAATSLHINVTDYVTGNATFDHLLVSELSEYVPFHANMDLSSRIDDSTSQAILPDDSDPYIVEKILKKRYNSSKVQYEYFVKWQGYLSSENTWELPSNIPQNLLETYERSLLQKQCTVENEPRRLGLRDRSTRKVTEKTDYILNT